jgi:topoisomerase-4 subunit A
VSKSEKGKKGTSKGAAQSQAEDKIHGVPIDVSGHENYLRYAVAMIEDRFVTGALDGVKPVIRRGLWAVHQLGLHHKVKHDKSAMAVGEIIGKFHPHGDQSCYSALVTAANSTLPTIDGDGNWGSMIDPSAAAYRYTNLRLTKYADLCFFDKFYLPTIQYIPNYDGSRNEPLNLMPTLPNTLLNGNFGMGPGVSTRIPAFTLKSVIKTLKKVIDDGGTCEVKHCMSLVPISEYGGRVNLKDPEVRKELRNIYKSGIGSLTWLSSRTKPDAKNLVRYNAFAPLPSDLTGKLTRISNIKNVRYIHDDGEEKDPYRAAFLVQLSPSLKDKDLKEVLKKVDGELSASQRVDIKVTDRTLNARGDGADIKLRSASIVDLVNGWMVNRINMEKGACTYWKNKRQERIDYLELMIHAINHLDIILKALKVVDSASFLKKKLKITLEQANTILDLKVRQLKKLEIKSLGAEIKELKIEIAGYDKRIKKPLPYIRDHLDELWNELKGEAKRQEIWTD